MRRRVREQAEGRARVLGVRDTKESRHDLDVAVQCDACCHQMLGPAVKKDNEDGQEKMDCARGMAHSERCPENRRTEREIGKPTQMTWMINPIAVILKENGPLFAA